MRALTLVLSLSIGFSLPLTSHCQAEPKQQATSRRVSKVAERKAILRVLNSDLNHETSDHMKVTPFSLTALDIQTTWALASIKPSGKQQLDPFKALLRRQNGRWRILTLGTNLHGSGKQYGVPERLWKKWELNGS